MKHAEADVNMLGVEAPPETHLKRRLSKLTMVGMAFAILKYVPIPSD